MSDVTSFQPSWYLRNGHVQTILASSPFRAWGKNPMCDAAREMIIKTPEGVRLQGYYSCQESKTAVGLVILLHGWEGSVDSTYITCTGKALYRRGYDIFRLNFRDHGDSHHLNPGIFYRIDRRPLIRKYFLKKWLQSLKIKQGLFPDLYDFSSLFSLKTIQAVTDQMLDQYSEFKSASDYFKNYSILNDAIDDLPVPTTIMTAADDPIIPVEDFQRLKLNHRTRLEIHTFGGHNGFIDGFFLKSWYEQKLADLFDTIVQQA
jgi:predicted alpha/beta-fold hydrolase